MTDKIDIITAGMTKIADVLIGMSEPEIVAALNTMANAVQATTQEAKFGLQTFAKEMAVHIAVAHADDCSHCTLIVVANNPRRTEQSKAARIKLDEMRQTRK